MDVLRETFRARPLDRLAVVTLLTSLYWVQVWGFHIDVSQSIATAGNLVPLSMIMVSIFGILASHARLIVVINSLFYLAVYLAKSPIASNNQAMAAYFSLVVVCVTAHLLIKHRFKLNEITREEMFESIAGPGRWLLAVMYFYGIYHKINADFLNPDVSCGVVLYRELAGNFGMGDWIVGHYGAIWATFVVETVAMIVLFSSRFKKIGFIIGIPFHIIIGWTGYGYYMDFSTIVMVTYALFLPASAPQAAFNAFARIAGGEARALLIGRIFMIAAVVAGLLFIGVLSGWREFSPSWYKYRIIFTLYAAAFYLLAVAFVPWRSVDNLPAFNFSPRWTAIVPILFFINGASPYLGLKTESSIAMFSNLHTEGGVTNHYVTGVLPFGAKYQSDLVRIVSTSDPTIFDVFDKRSGVRGMENDVAFVRYEFDRMLAKRPDIKVSFMHNGVLRTNDATWENTYLKSSWIAKKTLLFKPVDFERPKICTH